MTLRRTLVIFRVEEMKGTKLSLKTIMSQYIIAYPIALANPNNIKCQAHFLL